MKIKDLPRTIKKRAKVYIKHEFPNKKHKPKTLMSAFDWSNTTEGFEYWMLVNEGKFLDVENHLRELIGDDMSEDLYEVEKEKPFFLDEALEIKVNEPEVVPYKDELIKIDPIVESVREKLRQRSSVGIKKYGTTLADNNTDDFLLHLQEELLDAVLYIEKLRSK